MDEYNEKDFIEPMVLELKHEEIPYQIKTMLKKTETQRQSSSSSCLIHGRKAGNLRIEDTVGATIWCECMGRRIMEWGYTTYLINSFAEFKVAAEKRVAEIAKGKSSYERHMISYGFIR
jgi:hypothetical protein